MSSSGPLRVLVCPLDWGLGHATRCVPVIHELQHLGCEVMVATSGGALKLLKIEFPQLKFFEISSYEVDYSDARPLVVHLAFKAPKILSIIRKEHREVEKIVAANGIDFIISDNRYGCYHESIPTAIIIHQLTIKVPKGFAWISGMVNHYNTTFIKRFRECWVPDTPDHRLSGALSLNRSLVPKFVGPLSRMKKMEGKKRDRPLIVALLSGPEPQRTVLEDILGKALGMEAAKTGLEYRLVRGLPGIEPPSLVDHIIDHLPAKELNELIAEATVIIARPGYSTIMDLSAMAKKAVFIPTPGQSEQQYLAEILNEKKIAMMLRQDELVLDKTMLVEQLKNMDNFTGFTGGLDPNELLNKRLRNFLELK